MSSIMIIAPNMQAGEKYAREHGLDPRRVVTPRSTTRARGLACDDYVILDGTPLDVCDWAAITPVLLHAGEKVLDRFYYEAQGKLPPPIELPRKTVIKF